MEKMQESINKDLEELKNKHTETNNTIVEIKNNIEGIKSIISEAEEWISEVEDKMVEIISEEQNKVKKKKWKDLRTVSETSGTISNAPTFKNDRMISVHFQGKPFNIAVIRLWPNQ